MAYIQTTNERYPVTEQDIRVANPNTSFANPFVPPGEYAWVFPAPQPTFDPMTQGVREAAPVLTAKGHYEQQWEIYPLAAEQVAAKQAEANQAHNANIIAQIAALEAKQPRAVREALLNMDGAVPRLQALEDQIAALRTQMV